MKKVASAVLGLAVAGGLALAHPPVQKGKAEAQARFEQIKARIIHILDRKISFLEGRKNCVEKAQNWKELRACRPHRPVWHRKWRKFGPHKRMWHHPIKRMGHR